MEEYIRAGLEMLDCFVSIGVKSFDLTRTSIERRKIDYRPGRNIGAMALLLPELIPLCWRLEQNLIVRANKPVVGVLAQLDDLQSPQVSRVIPTAFLAVETSEGNYQIWIAIEDGSTDFVKRLMQGVGSDPRANCAGRVAGSPNCKPKYAPDFPAVRNFAVHPGHKVKMADLEFLGLPAPAPAPRAYRSPAFNGPKNRGWPDYDRCLRGAAEKKDGNPDRSRTDVLWCKWALQRGNSSSAVVMKLVEVSEKARQEWLRGNENYARRTVKVAETYLEL